MPHVELEPATSTYAAQTITQLTKWADDTKTKLHIRTFVLKCHLWGPNPQSRHMRPIPLRNLQNLQTTPKRRPLAPRAQFLLRRGRTVQCFRGEWLKIPGERKSKTGPGKGKRPFV